MAANLLLDFLVMSFARDKGEWPQEAVTRLEVRQHPESIDVAEVEQEATAGKVVAHQLGFRCPEDFLSTT